jgi:glyoxylase-like metal-dependent hydrolase (beta-lactamase superfamily II)
MIEERLYFRQLLAGRDVAAGDPLARQMLNFVYLVGDRQTGEALAVDPAYAPGDVLDRLEADGMQLTGVLITHFHPDHVGGDLMGYAIEGLPQLLERADVPVHVQAEESPLVSAVTGVTDALVSHASGDLVSVGAVPVELVHTPGHTPGSQCFLVADRLVAGDTLFLEGCGRTDLPGGDPEQMYFSLTQRLARMPDSVVLYPGHLYSPQPSATMGDVRQHNYVYRPRSLEEWMSFFGR